MSRVPGALLLCLLAAAPARAEDAVRLAVTGPFTGPGAPEGRSMRDGARIAAAGINAAGGIPVGDRMRRIELVERDEAGSEEQAEVVARALATDRGLSAVIGPSGGAAADRHLVERGVTKIVTSTTSAATLARWAGPHGRPALSLFRLAPHDGIQAAALVAEVVRRGLGRVAILHDSTRAGLTGRDDVLRLLRRHRERVQVVATERFNAGDRDLTAQLLQAKAANAQAVLLWADAPEAAAVSNGMAKLGMRMPLLGGPALATAAFHDRAGRNGNGALLPRSFVEEPVSPRARTFLEAWRAAHGVERIPSPDAAAQGHDAVLLLAAAVRQARSTETARVATALEQLEEAVPGLVATWRRPWAPWDPVAPETHEAFRRQHLVMGMVQDGRVVFANPADRIRLARAGTVAPPSPVRAGRAIRPAAVKR